MVSLTGISSGVVTTTPRSGRVAEDVEHPAGLVADSPTCTSSLMASGRGQLAHDVAGGGGVDDDQVVVALPHL